MKLLFDSPLSVEGLAVAVLHPTVRPERRGAYLLRLLRRGAPGAPSEVLRTATSFATELGWRGTLVAYGAALAARYDIFHFVAGVVIAAQDAARLAVAGADIQAFLVSARPDFSGGLACLSSLWAKP